MCINIIAILATSGDLTTNRQYLAAPKNDKVLKLSLVKGSRSNFKGLKKLVEFHIVNKMYFQLHSSFL